MSCLRDWLLLIDNNNTHITHDFSYRRLKINLKKSPFLVLLLILGIGGISSAYAITITLAGTTIVDGTITADQFIGATNIVTGSSASAAGGNGNTASGTLSTVGGGTSNTASASQSTISGGNSNAASALRTTVAGGFSNTASGTESTVSGGKFNTAGGTLSTVGGGLSNTAGGSQSTISGGNSNTASALRTTVAGGFSNNASGEESTISGGKLNTASGTLSTVGGGLSNTAGGLYSTISGGVSNEASGDYSFAAGRQAKAIHAGSTVFSDSTSADFSSTAANQFSIRASGGIVMDVDGGKVSVDGAVECDNCILGFYEESESEVAVGNDILLLNPTCDSGDIAISGGFSLNGDDFVVTNRQFNDDSWQVRIANPSNTFSTVAYVMCADYSPAH